MGNSPVAAEIPSPKFGWQDVSQLRRMHRRREGVRRMQQIFTARTLADAYIVRDVLHQEGIPASLRNEHLAEGHLPVQEGRPAVLVADGDVERARFILGEYLRDDDAASALGELAAVFSADEAETQTIMRELFDAAGALVRGSRYGEAVDTLHRSADVIGTSAAPFGVPDKAWQQVARLVPAAVQAAAADDIDQMQLRGEQLRALLRPYV